MATIAQMNLAYNLTILECQLIIKEIRWENFSSGLFNIPGNEDYFESYFEIYHRTGLNTFEEVEKKASEPFKPTNYLDPFVFQNL